jgi:hypothetical protein
VSERVAIVGTREPDEETVEAVKALVRSLPEGALVVSGGAKGVDSIAEHAAFERHLDRLIFTPRDFSERMEKVHSFATGDWVQGLISDRDACIGRNTLIAIACTRMVAFVRGSRGGTWDAVKQAERFKRPCEVVR